MTLGPEARLERYFALQVRERGGQSFKFAPLTAGNPDRLVLAPGGRFYLVELKADSGTLRPVQRLWAQRAAQIGHRVWVLRGRAEVDAWLDTELNPRI